MQKHLLALATGVGALALATAAFADSNTADTLQTGDGNVASVTQSSNGNSAYTGQSNNGNTFDIEQSGSNGWVGFSPTLRSEQRGGDGNTLVVRQGGTGNVVGATNFNPANDPATQGNTAGYSANQTGNSNTLRIDQGGSNNQARYQQAGDNNGQIGAVSASGANGLSPYSGGPTAGNNNGGGGHNYGDPAVTPTGLWNYVNQAGTDGKVSVVQSSGAAGANGDANGVIINQRGSRMTIDLNQTSGNNTGRNFAYFSQDGSFNDAKVTQASSNGANVVDIRQGDIFANSAAEHSSVLAAQNGSALDLYVNQRGDGNKTNTSQIGANNLMSLFQEAYTAGVGYENTVMAAQDGSDMRLLVNQAGALNDLTSSQIGAGHRATINQNGFRNTVDNGQSGTGQILDVTQTYSTNGGFGANGGLVKNRQENGTGTGANQLKVTQDGGVLIVDSFQKGTDNRAVVDQNGSYSTYNGSQVGTGNRADVLQGGGAYGLVNLATVSQNGMGNSSTITQNRVR